MNQPKNNDPGPPTWTEAIDGFRALRQKAGERLQQARESRRFLTPGDSKADEESWGRISAADAEWKHWNLGLLRAQAFVKVHPFMAKSLITAKCDHRNACWTGDDDGFYRDPMPVQSRVLPVEREPGSDDEEIAF